MTVCLWYKRMRGREKLRVAQSFWKTGSMKIVEWVWKESGAPAAVSSFDMTSSFRFLNIIFPPVVLLNVCIPFLCQVSVLFDFFKSIFFPVEIGKDSFEGKIWFCIWAHWKGYFFYFHMNTWNRFGVFVLDSFLWASFFCFSVHESLLSTMSYKLFWCMMLVIRLLVFLNDSFSCWKRNELSLLQVVFFQELLFFLISFDYWGSRIWIGVCISTALLSSFWAPEQVYFCASITPYSKIFLQNPFSGFSRWLSHVAHEWLIGGTKSVIFFRPWFICVEAVIVQGLSAKIEEIFWMSFSYSTKGSNCIWQAKRLKSSSSSSLKPWWIWRRSLWGRFTVLFLIFCSILAEWGPWSFSASGPGSSACYTQGAWWTVPEIYYPPEWKSARAVLAAHRELISSIPSKIFRVDFKGVGSFSEPLHCNPCSMMFVFA